MKSSWAFVALWMAIFFTQPAWAAAPGDAPVLVSGDAPFVLQPTSVRIPSVPAGYEEAKIGAWLVVRFPEGTRTKDGTLQPARSGIGLTVIKSSAPVVPVRVFGTYEAYGRNIRFPRPKRVMVKYGEPLDFRLLREEAASCPKSRLKEIYQQVADEIMAAIARLEPRED